MLNYCTVKASTLLLHVHLREIQAKKLPPKEFWVDKLKPGKIIKEDYEKAKLIFEEFDCRKMSDYYDLYLTTDTLYLACWFERLRALCLI